MMYDLQARYDSRASFYGKAKVVEEKGILKLYSYDTLVATVEKTNNGFVCHYLGKYSQTTTRHQKEFFRQVGLGENDIKGLFKEGNMLVPFNNLL